MEHTIADMRKLSHLVFVFSHLVLEREHREHREGSDWAVSSATGLLAHSISNEGLHALLLGLEIIKLGMLRVSKNSQSHEA